MSSSTTRSNEWIAKPPRMRQACTECHSAKIRCTGEKTGCARCLNSGLTCEYVVSMVGRMSKSNKRRKGNSAERSTTTTSSSVSNAIVPLATDLPCQGPPEGSSPNSTTFALQEFDGVSNDAFLHDFDLFSTDGASNKSTTTFDFSIQGLDMDFDIDQLTALSANTSAVAPTTPEFTPLSYNLSPFVSSNQNAGFSEMENMRRHFPHVYILSGIIKFLEVHVADKEIAIDEVMRINQACVAEITKIMGLEKYKLCKSCPMLLSTALELMLTLYENGISPEAQNPAGTTCASSSLQRLASRLPNLQFGVFQLDPQERISFANRILCRELKRYTQVVRSLTAERQSQGDDGSSFGRIHMRWMVELENRVEGFITTLQT